MPLVTGSRTSRNVGIASLCLLPVSFAIMAKGADLKSGTYLGLLALACLTQLAVGIIAIVMGARGRAGRALALTGGILGVVGAVVFFALGVIIVALTAAGNYASEHVKDLPIGPVEPGRPLRVRGRRRRAGLVRGEDWAAGPRPDASGLDEASRAALEAMWLRDAQIEHASVPAFARLSWLLAAAGAPAELLAWSHRAAIEEIGHARACFAIAAGYGGRSFGVEPMPELTLDAGGDPRVTLAVESVTDGCLLEDFNADVAEASAAGCEDPVVRAVLEQIAREERSHAELAWAIVAWLVERHGRTVEEAIARAGESLASRARPVGVEGLDLRAHGRLPDAELAVLWHGRVEATRARLGAILASGARVAA